MFSESNRSRYAITALSLLTLLGMRSQFVKEQLRRFFRLFLSENQTLYIKRQLYRFFALSEWPPKPETMVRQGSAWLIVLMATALLLVRRSHSLVTRDESDMRWVKEELKQREEQLSGVLDFAREKLSAKDPEIDVSTILSSSERVACCSRVSKLAREGYKTAAKGISIKIEAIIERLESKKLPPTGAEAAELQELVDISKDLLSDLDRFLMRKRPIYQEMALSLKRAKKILSIRRFEQLSKAFSLMEESSSYLPLMAISGLLSIIDGAVEALKVHYTSAVFSQAINSAKGEISGKGVQRYAVEAVFIVELLGVALSFIKDKVNEIGQSQYIRDLKVSVFAALISQDMEFLEKRDMHEYSYLVLKVDNVCQCLWNLPMTTIDISARILSSTLLLWSKSSKLSILMAAVLPLRLAINSSIQFIRNYIEASLIIVDVRGSFGNIMSTLVDKIAFLTLRVFAREPIEIDVYSQKLEAHERYQERGRFLYNLFSPIDGILDKFVEIIGIWYGSKLSEAKEMDASDLPSFVDVCYRTFDRIRYLYAHFVSVSEDVLEPAEKMYDLLKNKPKIPLNIPPYENMAKLEKNFKWSIEFQNVSFAYPTRPERKILDGISFMIDEGTHAGILGESGCGKSTVFLLLLRLYGVIQGRILIGGIPIEKLNPLWLRQNIAIVTQNTYFPFRTVKENLEYGCYHFDLKPSEQDMRKALEIAQCDCLFFDKSRFPQEWHTDLGKNAEKLSGGERQRLSLARAILKRPNVLLLDEATSALDEETQYRVQERLNEMHTLNGKKMTILTIAHRLSNFRHSDELLVIEKGRVVERGSPQELVEGTTNNKIFQQFLKRHNEALQSK